MGLFGKSKGLVGLDIGSNAIKACELKPSKGGGYQAVALGIEPLPPEAIVDGTILDAAVVVETISKLFRDARIKTKDVATSVSGNSVIIKKITLPAMNPDELEESIQWEAEQYIPFDIEDVNIDYQTLGESGENMDVLLVAVKKDKINDYTSVISQADLNPVLVDIDAFAMQTAYEVNFETPANEVVALVNIGASIMNINILRDGSSVFWRDISSGGNKYTEEIQKELHLSQEQAELLKQGQAVEGVPPGSAQPILEQVTQEIATEIQKTFDFFVATSNAERIHRIVIAGGTSQISALEGALSERFGAVVEVLNPFEQVQMAKGVDSELAAATASQFAVAVGLATRAIGDTRINLLRAKRGPQAGPKMPTEGIQPIHLALVGILLLALGYVGFQYYTLTTETTRLKSERSRLEAEKERLKPILEEKADLERKRSLLDQKIAIIQELRSKQQGPVRLLDELSRSLPDYVWFSNVAETNGELTINGFALNPNKIADFVENLERSASFKVTDGPHYTEANSQFSFILRVQFTLASPAVGTPSAQR